MNHAINDGLRKVIVTSKTVLLNKQIIRDQIVFIHKNEYGESFIEKMPSSKNPVRINKSVEQEYREGKFGAGVSSKIPKDETPDLFSK